MIRHLWGNTPATYLVTPLTGAPLAGLEPTTFRLTVGRFYQLGYRGLNSLGQPNTRYPGVRMDREPAERKGWALARTHNRKDADFYWITPG